MKTITPRMMALLFIVPIIVCSCMKETAIRSDNVTSRSGVSSSSNDVAAKAAKTYTIEQGNHYANGPHFPVYFGKVLSFSATFNNSAIYTLADPSAQNDENTLYGFADNNRKHERFSARFGWRWKNNQLQIAAYTNNYGKSTIVQIGSVPLGTPSTYSITVAGDHYDFTLNGVTTSLPRESKTASAGDYKLLPYFGGDAVAPQQITINIQEN